jgi:putative hemolysin
MLLDLTAILILFVVNGALSMSEIAIVTARRARLNGLAEKGHKGAEAAIALNRDPGRFLSTIQSGMTLIGVLTGAIGGAALTDPLALRLMNIAWLIPYAHDLAFAIVVLITSYISLIIGELVPKQIALRYAEPIAVVVAPMMMVVGRIGAPVIAVLDVSTRIMLRLFGVKAYDSQVVTEDEVKTLVAEGTETGVFHPTEREMVTRVLRFADRIARSIMTPRVDIEWFAEDDSAADVQAKIAEAGHSRYVLAAAGPEGLDHVRGVVHVRDLYAQAQAGQPFDLVAICRPVPVVHDNMPVLEVLETLREKATRLAIVVDEYGVVEGLVTMTDILEAVVGALPDMHGGGGDAPVEETGEDSWNMDGSVALDDVKLHLQLQSLPGEDEVATLGGFILTQLGRVPQAGDTIDYGGYSFTVTAMEGRRVDKVQIVAVKKDEELK